MAKEVIEVAEAVVVGAAAAVVVVVTAAVAEGAMGVLVIALVTFR